MTEPKAKKTKGGLITIATDDPPPEKKSANYQLRRDHELDTIISELIAALGDELPKRRADSDFSPLARYALTELHRQRVNKDNSGLSNLEKYGVRDIIPDFDSHNFHDMLRDAEQVHIVHPDLSAFFKVEGNLNGLLSRFQKRKYTRLYIQGFFKETGHAEIGAANNQALFRFLSFITPEQMATYLAELDATGTVVDRQEPKDFRMSIVPSPIVFHQMRLFRTEDCSIATHVHTINSHGPATVYVHQPSSKEETLYGGTKVGEKPVRFAETGSRDFHVQYGWLMYQYAIKWHKLNFIKGLYEDYRESIGL